VVLLQLRRYPPVSEALSIRPVAASQFSSRWKLSAHFCTLTEHLLRQGQYWAAEVVLKVLFLENFGLSKHDTSSYDQLQEAWTSIHWVVVVDPDQNEEHELWAQIAILQTFCEGLSAIGSPAAKPGVACGWSFSEDLLSYLLKEALSRDKTGDWTRSRALIRNKLLKLDNDVANDTGRGTLAWIRTMLETLSLLSEHAEDNQDFTMESSVHWRIRALVIEKERKGTADPSLIPLKIYAQWRGMRDPEYSETSSTVYERQPTAVGVIGSSTQDFPSSSGAE
jgi:hypothetical protein